MTDLLVNELYDKLTIQGEGPSIGRVCSFIRLFGCPMHCKWCDSAFTWRVSDKHPHLFAPVYDAKEESHRMTIEEITEHFMPINPPMLVITGGEPMVQSDKLPPLITELVVHIPILYRIEIETAGIIFDDKLSSYSFVHFNVSPKLEGSGNPKELRYKPDILRKFRAVKSIFKFVVTDLKEFEEIDSIVDEVKIHPGQVYIMPEGISAQSQEQGLKMLAEETLKRQYNLTTRLHVLIWGNERGR